MRLRVKQGLDDIIADEHPEIGVLDAVKQFAPYEGEALRAVAKEQLASEEQIPLETRDRYESLVAKWESFLGHSDTPFLRSVGLDPADSFYSVKRDLISMRLAENTLYNPSGSLAKMLKETEQRRGGHAAPIALFAAMTTLGSMATSSCLLPLQPQTVTETTDGTDMEGASRSYISDRLNDED